MPMPLFEGDDAFFDCPNCKEPAAVRVKNYKKTNAFHLLKLRCWNCGKELIMAELMVNEVQRELKSGPPTAGGSLLEEQQIKELAEKWTEWAMDGGRRSDTVSAIELAIKEALKITSNLKN